MKKKFETKLFQTSFLLLSIVHINAPLAAARHNPSKLGFCSRLAQTFYFSSVCEGINMVYVLFLLPPCAAR